MTSQRFDCPLDGCGESLMQPRLPQVNAAFADILGTTPLGMREAWVHQQQVEVEQWLTGHLSKHSVIDWSRTLAARNARIRDLEAEVETLQEELGEERGG